MTQKDKGLIINGKTVDYVSLVAFVYEIIEKDAQKIHLQLDDLTSGGPLEVIHNTRDTSIELKTLLGYKIQVQDEDCDLDKIEVSDYVTCIGIIRFNQEKPYLLAYDMKIVDDPNLVTLHTLEVIRDSMYYERIQATSKFENLSKKDKCILDFLEKTCIKSGVKFSDIEDNFKSYSKQEIIDSLEILCFEGLCKRGEKEDYWCVDNQNI